MTRAARQPGGASLSQPRRLAAIHRQGEHWRLVVVRAGGTAPPSVLEAISLSVQDAAGLGKAIERLKPDAVIGVIPSGETIWKMTDAAPPTEGSPEVMRESLSLVAEASLPSSVPAHRRGAGVVRLAGQSSLVAVGWTAGNESLGRVLEDDVTVWVPEPVALAALAREAGASAGALCSYADRAGGSITVVAAGREGGRVLVRVLREDASDAEAWRATVTDALAEAADAAGADAPAEPADHALVLPEGASLGLAGARSDAEWVHDYGIALGAALAASRAQAVEEPLLLMRPRSPVRRVPVVVRAVTWLNVPRRAALVGAACVLVLLLWPLAVAYSRLSVLREQAGAAEQSREEFTQAAEQADFYQLLREKRLPMVKLMADLTAGAPKGVVIESLSIDAARKVVVSGNAPSPEAVSEWREALSKTKVFDEVRTPEIRSSETPVGFTLNATVSQPMSGGTRPPAVAGAIVETTAAEAKTTAPGAARPEAKGRPERGDRNSRTPARTTGAAGAKPDPIPPPISDEAIAAMDRNTAMKEWAGRSRASKQTGLDEATKQRLIDEAAKAQRRMQEAPAGGAP